MTIILGIIIGLLAIGGLAILIEAWFNNWR